MDNKDFFFEYNGHIRDNYDMNRTNESSKNMLYENYVKYNRDNMQNLFS